MYLKLTMAELVKIKTLLEHDIKECQDLDLFAQEIGKEPIFTKEIKIMRNTITKIDKLLE